MDRNKLKRLLEAFYDGTATLEDEQNLYLYFTSANVSEELEAEKRVFLSLYNYYLSIDDEVEVPSSLNNKLDSLIDNLSERERSRKRKISLVRISAIAASFLILISVGVFVLNNRQPQAMLVDTFTDPQEAYLEARKTLAIVSNTLNSGLDPVKKVGDDISKANQIVRESLSKIK